MCRVAASLTGFDLAGGEKTSMAEIFESRSAVGSAGVGVTGHFRRPERNDAGGVVSRRGEGLLTGLTGLTVVRTERHPATGPCFGRAASERTAKLSKGPSMVFDLELDDEETGSTMGFDLGTVDAADRLSALLRSQSVEEQTLRDNVDRFRKQQTHATDQADDLNSRLAAGLQSLGYVVGIRRAIGGGAGGECLKNLRHTFLRASLPGQEKVFIVDPFFRDQFDVLRPTPEYARLFDALPESFVAPEDRVPQVVELLCSEMQQVFRRDGSTLPPWRRASSMLTKWKPRKSMDELPGPGALPSKRPVFLPSTGAGIGSRLTRDWRTAASAAFGGIRIKAVRGSTFAFGSDD